MDERIEKLPKWAQDALRFATSETDKLKRDNAQLQAQLAEYENKIAKPAIILEPYRRNEAQATQRPHFFDHQSTVQVLLADGSYLSLHVTDAGVLEVQASRSDLVILPGGGHNAARFTTRDAYLTMESEHILNWEKRVSIDAAKLAADRRGRAS